MRKYDKWGNIYSDDTISHTLNELPPRDKTLFKFHECISYITISPDADQEIVKAFVDWSKIGENKND